jgi:flagellar hook-associated protein 2
MSETMYSDAVGTVATDATSLDQLFDAVGTGFGAGLGDRITIIGTRPSGQSFVEKFDLTDPATQTLGDFRAAVQSAIGGDATVAFVNGVLTVTGNAEGPSQLALSITSDNAAGGTLSFGSIQVATQGRNAAAITASDVGGQLQITHQRYGASEGFEVSFTDGGTGGWSALGVAAGTYAGVDVAGTIGGFAATGSGRDLTGADGSIIEGLGITYTGSGAGLIGTFTFSRGIGASASVAADTLLGSGFGSIDSIKSRLETNVERLTRRIDDFNVRIERRRDAMVRRFTAMEQVIARFNSQSQWLEKQLQQFDTSSG